MATRATTLVRSAQHPVSGAPRNASQTSAVLGQLRGQEEEQEVAVKGFRSCPTLTLYPDQNSALSIAWRRLFQTLS